VKYKKKLIEVALPLEAINIASAREKSIRHGHPSTLHLWWARRPLAAARAVIFSQMVDDPSEHKDIFKTEKSQEKERQRLFGIIEELVKWESTTNQEVLQAARDEIWQSWRHTCAENADHPRANELFRRDKLPDFHDPFAGGGAIPLEAQRLGLESFASDLNPVAVLLNKAMIEIPSIFLNRGATNPMAQLEKRQMDKSWIGIQGLVDDVKYYGKLIRDRAYNKLSNAYPAIEITKDICIDRPDLKKYLGRRLTIITWIWARTVKSPNPAFANITIPLASTFVLSTKKGKETYLVPKIEGEMYSFAIKTGNSSEYLKAKSGTKLSRGANFECLLSGAPITGDYIKAEGQAGRMGSMIMAMVLDGDRERVYIPAPPNQLELSKSFPPNSRPDLEISGSTQYLGIKPYGMHRFDQIYTDRQLTVLNTLSDLVNEIHSEIKNDAISAEKIEKLGSIKPKQYNHAMYADTVAMYLTFGISRLSMRCSTLATWDSAYQKIQNTFGRQALAMSWDFCEVNPFSTASGNFESCIAGLIEAMETLPCSQIPGHATQADAQAQIISLDKVVSTDPPYYDNVPYADLSDYFYIWLRKSLKSSFPELFSTLAVPKKEELVAFAYRHENKIGAEKFFLNGMTHALQSLSQNSHPSFPVTIYYAFRQSETDGSDGTVSTGWETFLDAVFLAGFEITGTWPMRTEMKGRVRDRGNSNALASSIVLVCRKRQKNAESITRREFISLLKVELPQALKYLQAGNIAPVDLAQASIGPGMAVYTRYNKVVDSNGQPVTVRAALALINQTLDESLAEQEGDFDADTRWAITWFEQLGFEEGEFGLAEQLSKSKNISITGLEVGGILTSKARKVRLLRPSELENNWQPNIDSRLSIWEIVHQLIRVLEGSGEESAAKLLSKIGSRAEIARELCYRLYILCVQKKRSSEANSYNGLVQSWPEIIRLSTEILSASKLDNQDLFDRE
jgi:putative DNA methylase